MKVLLVAPYKAAYMGLAKFPPIGLGYLASSLKKGGFEVEILDCLQENFGPGEYEQYIRKTKPGLVGVNTWSLAVREVNEILDITKRIDSSIVTVIGGPHPSAAPESAMRYFSSLDFAFVGEAEIGLPLLIGALGRKRNDSLSSIPGLVWRLGDTWKINPQIFHDNLDDFSELSWDLIRPERYCQVGSITSGMTAPIITTRGCPYLCTFCSPHIIAGRKVRCRSTGSVIEEIRLLKDEHGIKTIAIMDENFTFYKKHAVSLCNRIIQEKLGMEFFLPNGIRLDTLDEELLLLMRKAGFRRSVAVGIESGSERILKSIRKNLSKEVIKAKVNLMIKCGFRPIGYFILGFPDETAGEMYETLEFAKELKLYRAAFSPLLVLPGTDIHKQLTANNELPADYDYSRLCTDNITRLPAGITREDFYRLKKDIIWKFNLQPRVLLDYMRDWNSFVFAAIKFREIFLKKHRG